MTGESAGGLCKRDGGPTGPRQVESAGLARLAGEERREAGGVGAAGDAKKLETLSE